MPSAVPPQFALFLLRSFSCSSWKKALFARTIIRLWLYRAEPVLFYSRLRFLQQNHRATSTVDCCGGFQPTALLLYQHMDCLLLTVLVQIIHLHIKRVKFNLSIRPFCTILPSPNSGKGRNGVRCLCFEETLIWRSRFSQTRLYLQHF